MDDDVSTSRLFSEKQRSRLRAYYETGMRGTGEIYKDLHKKCAKECGLSVVQVERWIKKQTFKTRHSKRSQQAEVPTLTKAAKRSAWHKHLKLFGATEGGRQTIIKEGTASFMKAASEVYHSLNPQERADLDLEEEPETLCRVGDIKRKARKYFLKIQSLFEELESLNYRCMAFGFFEDDVQVVTTKDCSSCISPRCLEYVHALTVVANPPPIPTLSDKTSESKRAVSEGEPCSSGIHDEEPPPKRMKRKTHRVEEQPSKEGKGKPIESKVQHPLSVTRHPPPIPRNPPPVARNPPPVARNPPPVAQHPPPVARHPPSVARHPPPVVRHPPPIPQNPPPVTRHPPPVARHPPPIPRNPPPVAPISNPPEHTSSRSAPTSSRPAPTSNPPEPTSSCSAPTSSRPAPTPSCSALPSTADHSPTRPPIPTVPSSESVTLDDSSQVIISSDTEEDSNVWIARLDLYLRDKAILEGTGWLNDGMIFAAMTLLREQTKETLCGWQSTQPGGLKPLAPGQPFVQLLHVQKSHWITVSNYSVSDRVAFADTVCIYDSGWPISVSVEVKKLVCSFYKCKRDTLTFQLMDVRRQQNCYDCGVLAIAYATDLVHDQDPTPKQWDTRRMRNHLQVCLEKGEMSCFPSMNQSLRRPKLSAVRKMVKEPLFCTCRLPNDRTRAMVKCDKCLMWYHYDCVGMKAISSNTEWVCSECVALVKTGITHV